MRIGRSEIDGSETTARRGPPGGGISGSCRTRRNLGGSWTTSRALGFLLRSLTGWCSGGHGEVEFDLQLPDEGGELPGDGDDDLVLADAPCLEFYIPFVEPVLHLP